MSDAHEQDAEPLITVAHAVRTRGLKGEIVAELLTDFPERFESLSELIAVRPGKPREIVELEDHWFQKGRVVLKLKGFDSIETASVLVGCDFSVPEAERVQLPEGSYYQWELQGCSVETVSGQLVGVVSSVLHTGGVEVLVIESAGKPDVMVPMAEAIVVSIDITERRVLIDPPPGLLEL
jgi:16S rRNA processing protein RimM